jgi:hypothetical protein
LGLLSNFENKGVVGTKLNRKNDVWWAPAFKLFLGSQNKLSHVTSTPLKSKSTDYSTWAQADCFVMTWLLNCMEESVVSNVMFLGSAKET